MQMKDLGFPLNLIQNDDEMYGPHTYDLKFFVIHFNY